MYSKKQKFRNQSVLTVFTIWIESEFKWYVCTNGGMHSRI
jgi:hypothetical protein